MAQRTQNQHIAQGHAATVTSPTRARELRQELSTLLVEQHTAETALLQVPRSERKRTRGRAVQLSSTVAELRKDYQEARQQEPLHQAAAYIQAGIRGCDVRQHIVKDSHPTVNRVDTTDEHDEQYHHAGSTEAVNSSSMRHDVPHGSQRRQWACSWGWTADLSDSSSSMEEVPNVQELSVVEEGHTQEPSVPLPEEGPIEQELAAAEEGHTQEPSVPLPEEGPFEQELAAAEEIHTQDQPASTVVEDLELDSTMQEQQGSQAQVVGRSPTLARILAMQKRIADISSLEISSTPSKSTLRTQSPLQILENARERLNCYESRIEALQLHERSGPHTTRVVTDAADWPEADVSRWLCRQGWSVHVAQFEANNVDGSKLLDIPRRTNAEVLLQHMGVQARSRCKEMIREILLLDSRWMMHQDEIRKIQRFVKKNLPRRKVCRRQASNRQSKQHVAQLMEDKVTTAALLREKDQNAYIIQAAVRAAASRKAVTKALQLQQQKEALQQKKEEAQRLSAADEAERLRLIAHREAVEAQRLRDAERGKKQMYKLALSWAEAEACTVHDKEKQALMQARLQALQAEVKLQNADEAKVRNKEDIVNELHAKKQAEFEAERESAEIDRSQSEKAQEFLKFGALSSLETDLLQEELDQGRRLFTNQPDDPSLQVEEGKLDNALFNAVDSARGVNEVQSIPQVEQPNSNGSKAVVDDTPNVQMSTTNVNVQNTSPHADVDIKEPGFSDAPPSILPVQSTPRGPSGKSAAELEAELREANSHIVQLQKNIDVAQQVIAGMDEEHSDAASSADLPPVCSFDELLTRLRMQYDVPVNTKKEWVKDACTSFKCSSESGMALIGFFKGRDLEDVAVLLYAAMRADDFQGMLKTIRPTMYARRIEEKLKHL